MRLKTAQERQERLESLLYELAKECKEEEELHQTLEIFKDIYAGDFRHSYSQFVPLVMKMAENEQEYVLDYLGDNITRCRELVEKDFFENKNGAKYKGLYRPLTKLSDHLNLEIQHYNCFYTDERINKRLEVLSEKSKEQDQTVRKLETETGAARQGVEDAKRTLEEMEERMRSISNQATTTGDNLKAAQTNLEKALEKLEKIEIDVVAVLSIFAAIVFAFSGGVSLMGSALTGLNEAPFFKSAFFVLLCGLVLFNSINLLMNRVQELIKGKNGNGKEKFVKNFNLVLILLAIAVLIIVCVHPDWSHNL